MTDEHHNNPVKEVKKGADATEVILGGDIDLNHAPALHSALVEVANERPKRLVLNLTAVPYMDSSGVGTLVEVFRRVTKYGGKLLLCGLQTRVRSVFEITKLDRFFTICDTAEQAMQQ